VSARLPTWRAIASAPDYEVSDRGDVRRGEWAVASWKGKRGYYLVNLELPGRDFPSSKHVHELVLEAFDRPRPPGCQADHVDGDRSNNAISNLEWVTPAENVRRARARARQALERVFGQLRLFERAS
jgi:hypothetical protein